MRKFILLASILLSCSTTTSDTRKNHEATVLHNSMMKKAAVIRDRLEELKGDSTLIQDSIAAWVYAMDRWQADVVEVPGNEHHEHENHDHHEHNPPPDVTEEQMLDIQKELDERLTEIGKRVASLKRH